MAYQILRLVSLLVLVSTVAGGFLTLRKPPHPHIPGVRVLYWLVRLLAIGALMATAVQVVIGVKLNNSLDLLRYASWSSVYWIWQCLLLYCLYLLLRRLRVSVRRSFFLAIGLLAVTWFVTLVQFYLVHQLISGGPAPSLAGVSRLPKLVQLMQITGIASNLACTVFYLRCRGGVTRTIAAQSADPPVASQPSSLSVQCPR